MKRILKKVLPTSWIVQIRHIKAHLKIIMRDWNKFKAEDPEGYARVHADRVHYD